jgi:hypothetical protein
MLLRLILLSFVLGLLGILFGFFWDVFWILQILSGDVSRMSFLFRDVDLSSLFIVREPPHRG